MAIPVVRVWKSNLLAIVFFQYGSWDYGHVLFKIGIEYGLGVKTLS